MQMWTEESSVLLKGMFPSLGKCVGPRSNALYVTLWSRNQLGYKMNGLECKPEKSLVTFLYS